MTDSIQTTLGQAAYVLAHCHESTQKYKRLVKAIIMMFDTGLEPFDEVVKVMVRNAALPDDDELADLHLDQVATYAKLMYMTSQSNPCNRDMAPIITSAQDSLAKLMQAIE